ncbi:MAG: RNA-guided endonuclease InsQ/TnpB family protein [Parachlamydiaceae bacterium]
MEKIIIGQLRIRIITEPPSIEGEIVGVDVGLNHFATLSNKIKIAAPKPLEKKIKRLKRLSKQHSRKIKGSKNRKKWALKLARQHRKIGNTRQDFLHKTSTKLAKTKSVMMIEDLDIKSPLQGPLNRSIHDVGWGKFRRMLEYKTMWYGSKLVVAPRYYPSTKKCSHSDDLMNKMSLSLREWSCPKCEIHHDRDINASQNLVNYYTGSSPGIYACGDSSGSGTGNWSTSHEPMKQELMNGIFVHKL